MFDYSKTRTAVFISTLVTILLWTKQHIDTKSFQWNLIQLDDVWPDKLHKTPLIRLYSGLNLYFLPTGVNTFEKQFSLTCALHQHFLRYLNPYPCYSRITDKVASSRQHKGKQLYRSIKVQNNPLLYGSTKFLSGSETIERTRNIKDIHT